MKKKKSQLVYDVYRREYEQLLTPFATSSLGAGNGAN